MRAFTQEEKNMIDELAMHFVESSHDFRSLSYALQASIRERLMILEMRQQKLDAARHEPGLEANKEIL